MIAWLKRLAARFRGTATEDDLNRISIRDADELSAKHGAGV